MRSMAMRSVVNRRLGIASDFLEGLLVFNQSQEGNNRSVMPLDVLGRTRATLSNTASHLFLCRKVRVILSTFDVMGIDRCNCRS